MTDRELLEYAMKAAGLTILYWAQDDYPVVQGGDDQFGWNPLKFDSDALWLAVKLRIDIRFPGRGTVQVAATNSPITTEVIQIEVCPYAATRRAIVRAAAEIGKEMK